MAATATKTYWIKYGWRGFLVASNLGSKEGALVRQLKS